MVHSVQMGLILVDRGSSTNLLFSDALDALQILKRVSSMGVTDDDKDRLEVVGDSVDPVCLVSYLRRKIVHAEIALVEEVKDKKPEEKEKKKSEEPTMQPVAVHPPPQWYPGYYYHHHHHPPPPMVVCEEPSNCPIM
ncbi:disease resistance protein RGA5-like [Phragmites australis]|uniref:disease resistance protein RGA5-like n=1 Tax=Phragmites australis TaxID=29695 RepID=UPI002D792DEA|nr:disease resistance protein RGA5-like [Phragmites australis]